MSGLFCRACRRWVLGWPHILLIILFVGAVVVVLLELLLMLSG